MIVMKFLKTLLILSILNLIALILVTLRLPDQVPIHVNYLGQIDGYGPKWSVPVLSIIAPILMITAMVYRKQTDNGKVRNNKKVESILFPVLGIFFIGISWMTVYIAMQTTAAITLRMELIAGLPLGILMIILGNYMGTIKYNKTLGIRTPWTLKNEEVWHKTHRMGSYWGVLGGFIILATSLYAYFTKQTVISVIGILVGVLSTAIIPTIYSYWIYEKINKKI